MIFLICLLYIFVALLEIPPLVQRSEVKKLVLYIFFFGGALVISLLLAVGIDLPSPAQPIDQAIDWVKDYLGGGN